MSTSTRSAPPSNHAKYVDRQELYVNGLAGWECEYCQLDANGHLLLTLGFQVLAGTGGCVFAARKAKNLTLLD